LYVLVFELRTLHLLDRCSIALSHASNLSIIFDVMASAVSLVCI
jgi:hypothetical protein